MIKPKNKSDVLVSVSQQIIKIRNLKGLSQGDLAKLANTTQAVISRIENASVNYSLAMLQKIASALGKKLEINLV